MKKKHLRALSSLENWLKDQGLLTEELNSSLGLVRGMVEASVETKPDIMEKLPPPSEIEGDLLGIALYTDGGCRGNPGPGAYAFVVQNVTGEVLIEGGEFESHTTNNKMELSGPINGLREIISILPSLGKDPLLTRVKVMTDSKYVVDGMKSWVQGWKARGWRKADNKPPENLEYWQQLDVLKNSFMAIEWIWIKGHGGHPQNEYCDKKVNEAMDEHLS
jgi:ribonuclease HI